jgi:hypothetical protein
MDSLLDQINSLIKMQVGDPYRLEHIKVRVEENKILTLSDKKYLSELLDRYIGNVESKENLTSKIEPIANSPENFDSNNCWKCGNKNSNFAKFCNYCGSSIEKSIDIPKITPEKSIDIPKITPEKSKQDSQSWIQTRSTTMPKRMGKGKKSLIILGILAILILISGIVLGDDFLKTIEQIIDNLQQQIGSLLEGLSIELTNPHNLV